MNKFLRVIAIAICISLVLVGLSACTTNANYFTFEPNSDETGYIITGTSKILPDKVVLPNKYQGKPVVKATIESQSVKELTISSNIKELSLNCVNLKEVETKSDFFVVQNNVVYNSKITHIVAILPSTSANYVMPRTIVSAEKPAFEYALIENLFIPQEYYQVALDNISYNGGIPENRIGFTPLFLCDKTMNVFIEVEQDSNINNILYESANITIQWNATIPS